MSKQTTTLYFNYDLRFLPKDPLQRFSPLSDFQMEESPENYLSHYQYKAVPGGTDTLRYYHSATVDAEYLIIALIERADTLYRLVFHCHDDKALVAWKQRFGDYLHRILDEKGILPDPPAPVGMNIETHHLNPVLVHNMTGGWY